MFDENVIGVVIPAFNEEGHIGDVIQTVPDYVDYVYPVDDASNDDTWSEIRSIMIKVNERGPTSTSIGPETSDKRTPMTNGGVQQTAHKDASAEDRPSGKARTDTRIIPIRHETNRGVGGAIKTGYRRAMKNDVDAVAVIAGDGQMDPDHLERLLDPVINGPADYAKGNRLLLPQTRSDMPSFRLLGNVLLSGLTKVASGYWRIGDSQNGYTAITREALEAINFEQMYEFYGYCNDLLVKLNVSEMVIADVAIPCIYDDEESSIRYPTYIPRVSSMLLRNFLWRLKEKYVIRTFHPLVLLYGLGVFGTAISLWRSLAGSNDGELSVMNRSRCQSLIPSVMCLVFAMLSDRRENEDLQERIRNLHDEQDR